MKSATLTVVVAACVLLAGCTAGREVPPGMSPEDAQQLVDEQNTRWWNEMFPDEPQPVVEPIEYLTSFSMPGLAQQCLVDANIPGVTAQSDGSLYFVALDADAQDAFNRANYICALSYPYDLSDPESLGYLSDAQLDYLDDYYRARLTPCLRLLGYAVTEPPLGSSPVAFPYWMMSPQPETAAEWAMIDLHCPPPPIGPAHPRGS